MAVIAYHAPWILTGLPDDAPLRDGAVVLDGAEVRAVGASADIRERFPDAELRHERAILMPGLVNAHVHLELSALRGHTKSGAGFGPWVAGMMDKRAALLPEQDAEAIDAAVSELLRAGTAAIGEVTNSLSSLDSLATAPILARIFHEIFGMRREVARAVMGMARAAREARGKLPAHLAYALAPHTLYSLHPDIVQEIADEARTPGSLTSLHLAEHAAERAFLKDGSGPFADFLRARKVDPADWPPPGLSPVAYAERLRVLSPSLLAVHLCDASPAELQRVKALGSRVVLCPRSNLFIELKLPPLKAILDAGFEPALGTDSLASNTTLDVLAEAAALRDRFPEVPPARIFAMATSWGAKALGVEHRVGALAAGRSPGLIALDVADVPPDPWKLVLRAPPLPRRVIARPGIPTLAAGNGTAF